MAQVDENDLVIDLDNGIDKQKIYEAYAFTVGKVFADCEVYEQQLKTCITNGDIDTALSMVVSIKSTLSMINGAAMLMDNLGLSSEVKLKTKSSVDKDEDQ